MTSIDERRDINPLLAATAGDVERGIARELFKRGFENGADAAYAVMTVAGPVLEAKDDEITRKDEEITRLRAAAGFAATAAESMAAGECVTVLELSARASERVRCAAYLDSTGFTDAADALTAHPGARALDAREGNLDRR